MSDVFDEIKRAWQIKKIVISEKNGTILIRKFFCFTEIMVGNCYQSGPYIDRMFRKLFKKIPKHHPVKQVLLLGLGGGGAVREIKKRFKGACVTAIEYDPIMVDIAKQVYLSKKDLSGLQIILGDARLELDRLQKKFDLVIVDLFFGQSVAELVSTETFVQSLTHKLEQDGYLAVNFFREKKTVSPYFDACFSRWEDVCFNVNRLALFRHFGQGKVGDPVPIGYEDRNQSRVYLEIEKNNSPRKSLVGKPDCLGLQTTVGKFVIADYCSDEEPTDVPKKKFGIINWQSYSQTSKKGWLINHVSGTSFQKGIGVITEQNQTTYFQEWSKHARRHRERWLHDAAHEIVETDISVFAEAYHASKKLDWILRVGFVRVLEYHLKRHKEDVKLFVAREKDTQKIIAGLAVVEFPDIAQSCHMVSFICNEARHTSVGVGLIDHWYAEGVRRGIRFFNFGIVWKKGDPRAWKGYSQFKRQFNLYLLNYPKAFIKFFWS